MMKNYPTPLKGASLLASFFLFSMALSGNTEGAKNNLGADLEITQAANPFELRINSGGGQVAYGTEVFESDIHFTGNGKSYTNNSITDIANTSRDALYLTERSAQQNLGDFGYAIPVANGNYTLHLHFAEIYWGATGGGQGGANKRVFSVQMEGVDILSDYDINQEVGSMTAVVKTYSVTVLDGILNLNFSASVDQPKISALELLGVVEPPPAFVKRINSGGEEIVYGSDVFEADDHFTGNGKSYSNNNITDIANTSRDALYLTERSAQQNLGNFGYAIPVPDGDYNVHLHFAEIYWGATGGGQGGANKRVFTVQMEGVDVLSDYDINQDVGSMTAVVKAYSVTVSDGILNLNFSASVDQPKISAIEIYGEEQPPDYPLLARFNCGGNEVNTQGLTFDADTYFIGDGRSYTNGNITDIAGTSMDAIYISERTSTTSLGTFGYSIPVTPGNYNLKLHFAEIWWGATGGGTGGNGKRVFNMNLEGIPTLVNYDIIEEVGTMTAVVKSYTIPVNDGTLNIDFSATVDQAKISAIELFGDGQIIDAPASCEWNTLASSSFERLESQSAKVNDKLYVFAGFEHGLKITSATEIYDPDVNNWSAGAPMPVAVTHMGIAVAGDDIWVVAGFVGDHPGTATDRVQIYNTTTNSWRNGPDLPNPRGSGTATMNNGKIHFFGGLLPDRSTDVGEHYILDLNNVNSGWQPAAPLPNPRNHLSAASVDGIVYAIGGQFGHDNGVVDQKFLHAYNPVSNSWVRMADLPSDRSHFEPGTMVHNGKIIIAGGRDGFHFYDDIIEYDPITNTWAELCKLSKPLLAPAAKVIGDKLIVANGGENGTCCPISTVEWIPMIPETNPQPGFSGSTSKSASIKVYPNPSTDEVEIDLNDNPQAISVIITTLSSQKVEEISFKGNERAVFNLKEAPGIYLLKIRLESGEEIVRKVVKL